jgi:pimeloyl-ACP methyl ester carboxylesterase
MERSLGIALVVALAACLACDARTPEPPAADAAAPLELDASARRLDLRFPCGDASCAGWLYLPPGGGRAPVVVMAHGFAGTRDVALPFFAERFAARGLAAFVFDYRHFGASGGAPRQLVDPWTQLEDWRGALAFVRAHESLDPARVALWGSSMGGGLALITAAEDGAVRAAVAQVPLVDSGVEGEATFYGAWWLVRLLFLAFADLAVAALGGDSLTLPAIAPAGGFGMIVDDQAYAAFERLVEPGSSYRNAVVAHSIFTFDDWNPAPHAPSIRAPILLVASRTDRFAPFAAVESFARAAPDARIEVIDGDHFDVYSPPLRERAAELAAEFLATKLD